MQKNKSMNISNVDNLGSVVIFRPKGDGPAFEVQLEKESVWLSLNQMAQIFERDKSVISRHLRNVFESNELRKFSVVANFATTAVDGKTYNVEYYNLDAIISVGYRVNSKRGTQFRIWATNVLKQHLVNGYTINQKRLKEHAASLKTLQDAVKMLADLSERKPLTSEEAKGLFQVIRDYSYGLDVLDDYDHGRIEIKLATAKKCYQLTYDEGIRIIEQIRHKFAGSSLFGLEKDASFKSALGAIYQTFSGKDLYPSIEEKAANLLYFVVKNHAFSDGNKRIAAALVVNLINKLN